MVESGRDVVNDPSKRPLITTLPLNQQFCETCHVAELPCSEFTHVFIPSRSCINLTNVIFKKEISDTLALHHLSDYV